MFVHGAWTDVKVDDYVVVERYPDDKALAMWYQGKVTDKGKCACARTILDRGSFTFALIAKALAVGWLGDQPKSGFAKLDAGHWSSIAARVFFGSSKIKRYEQLSSFFLIQELHSTTTPSYQSTGVASVWFTRPNCY